MVMTKVTRGSHYSKKGTYTDNIHFYPEFSQNKLQEMVVVSQEHTRRQEI